MPIQRSPLEALALQLGEAINDDCAAWGVERGGPGSVYLYITTLEGRTYKWHGEEAESEGDVA